MLQITADKAKQLESENNVGYVCFMGSVGNWRENVIVATDLGFFLLENEPIPDWLKQQMELEWEQECYMQGSE